MLSSVWGYELTPLPGQTRRAGSRLPSVPGQVFSSEGAGNYTQKSVLGGMWGGTMD